MGESVARPVEVFTKDDAVHVRVDAPGERAVSAPILDPAAFIVEVARMAGFDVDEQAPGEVYISWPSG